MGRLVLVATPIGHLGDLSPRAAETLAAADAVACEDTRRTGRLYDLAGIARPRRLIVVNDHTEARARADVIAVLDGGGTVAVVTDAGTPAVSDPGERLVRAAVRAGHEVTVVPGPSAAVAALVVSGLPTGRFCVEGFLPRSGSGRTERLGEVAAERRTTVLFEGPHRLARTLADLAEACGPDRRVAVARELTKVHEEVWRGTLAEAARWAAEEPPRGEVTLVLEGAPGPPEPTGADVEDALRARLDSGVDRKQAVADVARALGVPKREVYDVGVRLAREGSD